MEKQRRDRMLRMDRCLVIGLAVLGAFLFLSALLFVLHDSSLTTYADPISPPEGYPKLDLSVKTVSPTLAHTGGVTLYYTIEIYNTGAYAASGTTLADTIPPGTTYLDDAQSSVGGAFDFDDPTLTWTGDVGFDTTVVISFSVSVPSSFSGTVRNTAAISHPLIAEPITVTTETVVADQPVLTIEKTAVPAKPGVGKTLTYTLLVSNQGQPAVNMPITVTDQVPSQTSVREVGSDGIDDGTTVTWTRSVTLGLGESTVFTFSVDIDSVGVSSGTVIANDNYQVVDPDDRVSAGDLYTVTVAHPVFRLSKRVWPDPPGSNREMVYTLTLLNLGSLATNLTITDRVPAGVTYQHGGTWAGGVVSWDLPSLDTGESAQFTYTVDIGNVADVAIVNDEYGVTCDEGIHQSGKVLTSTVWGPMFETVVILDPIAKKPGGGGGPVTPTLMVRNLGPGNALSATVWLEFWHISVNANQFYVTPTVGTPPPFPNGKCADKCVYFTWEGNLGYGEAITFTTTEGQSSKVGEEGTIYTATVVVSDALDNMTAGPVTGTATGTVTHYANLIPIKNAPSVIGRGKLMTYTIQVWNSALATEEPPSPVLTDVVPMSTTLIHISDGGVSHTVDSLTIISWTLPGLGSGDSLFRSFTVRTDKDLVSGTQIINADYGTSWYESEITGTMYGSPETPVTTTIKEVGLVDSYKEVTPVTSLPGVGNVLTYHVHIVNSSELDLFDVAVYDLLPWKSSTYQRDADASAGDVISDIVSVHWTGDVPAFSSQIVTLTAVVDPYYQGVLTNTAVISHPDLLSEVEVQALAYVTEDPVLHISKSASPDSVRRGDELAYSIKVINLGQQATDVVITDTIPADTEYVSYSATGGGQLVGDQIRWEIPVLKAGESHTVEFRVTVQGGDEIVNDQYAVTCAEGVTGVGPPVITSVTGGGGGGIYLPLVLRNYP